MPTGVRTPVESMSSRALIGCVQALVDAGNPERRVHLGDELLVCDPVGPERAEERLQEAGPAVVPGPLRPPLLLAASDATDGLEHRERRRVGRGLGPAGLAVDALDLGEAGEDRGPASRAARSASPIEIPGSVVGM